MSIVRIRAALTLRLASVSIQLQLGWGSREYEHCPYRVCAYSKVSFSSYLTVVIQEGTEVGNSVINLSLHSQQEHNSKYTCYYYVIVVK